MYIGSNLQATVIRGERFARVTFAIGSGCVDVRDRSCVDVCPVDCIYEGGRKLYINPDECIDCGACMTECPMNAVVRIGEEPDSETEIALDNAAFFLEVLPGRSAPIGTPGEAAPLGRIGVDTSFVAALPPSA